MAANTSDPYVLADGLQFVNTANAQSNIWNYFAYISDSQGKPTDTRKPVSKRFYKAIQSNLAKHPAVGHANQPC